MIILTFAHGLAGNECCERLAYYGMSTNLLLYFKHNLNQHSTTASKNLSNWQGTCYITPLIGAFAADAYLGRYWTIAIFSVIYVLVSIRLPSIPMLFQQFYFNLFQDNRLLLKWIVIVTLPFYHQLRLLSISQVLHIK